LNISPLSAFRALNCSPCQISYHCVLSYIFCDPRLSKKYRGFQLDEQGHFPSRRTPPIPRTPFCFPFLAASPTDRRSTPRFPLSRELTAIPRLGPSCQQNPVPRSSIASGPCFFGSRPKSPRLFNFFFVSVYSVSPLSEVLSFTRQRQTTPSQPPPTTPHTTTTKPQPQPPKNTPHPPQPPQPNPPPHTPYPPPPPPKSPSVAVSCFRNLFRFSFICRPFAR